MNWPLITRTRHQREVDAQKHGYDLKHAALQQRINDLEAAAVADTETGMVLACLEGDLAAEKKRADQLQARLDDALGLNTTAVMAGSAWQERRETKMRWDK